MSNLNTNRILNEIRQPNSRILKLFATYLGCGELDGSMVYNDNVCLRFANGTKVNIRGDASSHMVFSNARIEPVVQARLVGAIMDVIEDESIPAIELAPIYPKDLEERVDKEMARIPTATNDKVVLLLNEKVREKVRQLQITYMLIDYLSAD